MTFDHVSGCDIIRLKLLLRGEKKEKEKKKRKDGGPHIKPADVTVICGLSFTEMKTPSLWWKSNGAGVLSPDVKADPKAPVRF